MGSGKAETMVKCGNGEFTCLPTKRPVDINRIHRITTCSMEASNDDAPSPGREKETRLAQGRGYKKRGDRQGETRIVRHTIATEQGLKDTG